MIKANGKNWYYNLTNLSDGKYKIVINCSDLVGNWNWTSFEFTIRSSFIKGDANRDGRITAADALLYLRFAVGQNISPYYLDPILDDVTCDGRITASDALKVLRKAVGQDLSKEACPW